jgi:uncharacterized protein (TIGR02145 family)
MKKFLPVFTLIFWLINMTAFSQVGIGTNSPDSSAVLDLQSTNQGFLMPRLTTLQQLQIDSPAIGLMIFNLDSLNFWYFTGEYWLCMQDFTDTIYLTDWIPGLDIEYEGQTYGTVLIGGQCWMNENLNYETGTSWCYNNDPSYCITYGRLYNWATIMNGANSSNFVPSGVQGICPTGWHIPSKAEWDILINHLGTFSVAGGKMKEIGFEHWNVPNVGATNESGFTALPGGRRRTDGTFYHMGEVGIWWSTTDISPNSYASSTNVYYDIDDTIQNYISKANGFSLRCIKD